MAVQHLLDTANDALDSGRHDEAMQHLRSALIEEPTCVTAAFALADLYEARDEPLAVLQLMRSLTEKRIETAEIWLRMGRAVGQIEGEIAVAKRLLKRAASMAKDDAPLLTEIGRALGAVGEITLAANVLMKAATHDVANPAPYRTLAELLDAAGRTHEALSAWETTLALAPYDVSALQRTAELLMHLDRHAEAIQHLYRALRVRPTNLRLRARFGYACYGDGRYDAAITEFDAVLAEVPDLVIVRAQRARALQHVGRSAEAIEDLAIVLEATPDDADAWVVYGAALADVGQSKKAESVFRLTIAKAPESALAWAHLGMLCTHDGRVDEGYQHLERAIELNPRLATAYFAAAWSGRFKDAKRLEALLEEGGLSRDDEMLLHFALARIYDRRGDVDQAASHAARGNGMKRIGFNRAGHLRLVEEIERAFAAPASAPSGRDDVSPVFVVGMPRSGTSLVTQVLAAHPDLRSVGETETIPLLARDLALKLEASDDYPRCAPADGDAVWRSLADDYLAALPPADGDERATIDKLPGNFLHLGFIERMFPNARIVHVTRDVADSALSMWMTPFVRDHLPYSYDLEDIATFARHHDRIMAHWADACGLEIIPVSYEDLVTDPTQTTSALLEALGLPFDASCLASHEAGGAMVTASAWQVREPIYTSSVGRAMAYLDYLDPIAELVFGEGEESQEISAELISEERLVA